MAENKTTAFLDPKTPIPSVDQSLQSIADVDPARADHLADILGYGSKPMGADILESNDPLIRTKSLGPDTEAAGLQGMLEASMAEQDAYIKNLQNESASAEKDKNVSLSAVLQGLAESPGKEELTADAYGRSGGVDELDKELVGINSQIREEQHSLRRKLEALEKNPRGFFGGALTDEMEDVRRESLRKQADLSIIQQGIQGRYDSAKTIADRAIGIQFERQERKNQMLQTLYNDYKSTFDKKEQRAFETKQAERNRVLEEQKDTRKSIYDLALTAQKNGAPASVVQSILASTTREGATEAIGTYMTDPLDRALKNAQLAESKAQIANIYSQIAERNNKGAGIGTSIIAGAKDIPTVKALLADFTKSDKINATTRTQIAKGVNILGKLEEMVKGTPTGDFAGGPLRSAFAWAVPAPLEPGFKALQADEAKIRQDLVTYITGAAYTSLQANDVDKIIPRSQTWDGENKRRVNALANTIMGDLESALVSSGQAVQLPRFTDLFTSGETKEQEVDNFGNRANEAVNSSTYSYNQKGINLGN